VKPQPALPRPDEAVGANRVGCPAASELEDYLNGWSDDSQSAGVEAHLTACDDCNNLLSKLHLAEDTLLRSLRDTVVDDLAVPGSRLNFAAPQSVENGGTVQATSSRETVDDPDSDVTSFTSETFGPYELLRPLGSGGMGSVFLARHRALSKNVALKTLPFHLADDPELRLRFEREVQCAGKVSHPAIVNTTDAGVQGRIPWLVMDYIDGLDLSRLSRVSGRLQTADACEIVRQAALGLQHAHDLGIVHRDVKPSNLMLDRSGNVRILDFGVARYVNAGQRTLTQTDQLMGTLDYMAPEQATAAHLVDRRADLYALGATLFRLMTGVPPLSAGRDESAVQKLHQITTAFAPPLGDFCPDASPVLCELVAELLSRHPDDRPGKASDVAQRLKPFCVTANLVALLSQAEESLTDCEKQHIRAVEPTCSDPGVLPVRSVARRSGWRSVTRLAIGASIGLLLALPFLNGLTRNTGDNASGGGVPVVAHAVSSGVSFDGFSRATHPRITATIPSIASVKSDLGSLLALSEPNEPGTLHAVHKYLNLLGIGIDHSRPVDVDVLSDLRDVQYIYKLPLAVDPGSRPQRQWKGLLENLDAFGYVARLDRNNPLVALYKSKSESGWLRLRPESESCLLTSATRNTQLLNALRRRIDVSDGIDTAATSTTADAPPPDSLSVLITNSQLSSSDQFQRRVVFRALRHRSHDRTGSDQSGGNMATGASVTSTLTAAAQDMVWREAERLYADSKMANVYLMLDPAARSADVRLIVTPIHGSSLDRSITSPNASVDLFHGVPVSQTSVLSLHSFMPLDAIRQEDMKAVLDAVHDKWTPTKNELQKSDPTRHTTANVILAALVEICRDVIRTGRVNMRVECTGADDGRITMLAAIAVPDARRLNSVVSMLADLHPSNHVKSLTGFPAEYHCYDIDVHLEDCFSEFLLPELRGGFLIAVGSNQVWLATGENATKRLSDGLRITKPDKHTSKLFHGSVRPLVWLQRAAAATESRLQIAPADAEMGDTLNRRAIRSLADNDTVSITVQETTDGMKCVVSCTQGVLRIFAHSVGDFVHKNLR
jgi:serine/threonine protein kinase